MVLYEIALPILPIEPLSVFLKSAEEFEQGSPLGIRQAANPFGQLVRQFVQGPRSLGRRVGGTLRSGGGFTVSGHQPLRIDVEGMGVKSRSNRRECSLTVFVGGIVRPAESLGNLIGTTIARAPARLLKTCCDCVGAL